jgi:hypothetical protein
MRDFTKRQNPRQQTLRFFAGIAGILALSFITFAAAHAAWGMYGKFAEAAQSDDEAQQNLTELKEQEAHVSAAVGALSSSRGQDAQLRQSYGVALPGEGEIQIIEESASSTPAAKPEPNLLVRIWQAVFP